MKHYTPAGWVDEPGNTIGPRWGTQEDYERLLAEWDADPASFVTRAVFALTWKLKNAAANITGIYCDQWCAVAATGAPFVVGGMFPQTGEDGRVITWIQCDEVEHGIAATWYAMAKHFGQDKEEDDER